MTAPSSAWACPADCDHGTITVRTNAAGTETAESVCPGCMGRGELIERPCARCGTWIARGHDPEPVEDPEWGWVCLKCSNERE